MKQASRGIVSALLLFGYAIMGGYALAGDVEDARARCCSFDSETGLRERLTVGMSTGRLLEAIGAPDSIDVNDHGVESWWYSNRLKQPETNGAAYTLVGCSLSISSGRVSSLHVFHEDTRPVRVREMGMVGEDGRNKGGGGVPLNIALHVECVGMGTGRRYIDTKDFPQWGFVSNTPDLLVTNVAKVSRRDVGVAGVGPTETSLTIKLEPRDHEAMKELTSKNVNRKMLVIINGYTCASAKIWGTVPNGIFMLSVIDDETMKRLEKSGLRTVE